MMNVLVAPSGRRFSSKEFSENGWIYDIVTGVASQNPSIRLTCVSEFIGNEHLNNIHEIAVRERRAEIVGGFLLPFRIRKIIKRIDKVSNFDVFHHALPFSIGRSFSLLPLLSKKTKKAFIVGPLQRQLSIIDRDQFLQQQGNNLLIKILNSTASFMEAFCLPLLKIMSFKTLNSASKIIVIDQSTKNLLIKSGIDSKKVEVIPPPVRVDMRIGELLKNGLNDVLKLVTTSHLVSRKNIHKIIESVATLNNLGVKVTLQVIGDGPRKESLQRLTTEFGIEHLVSFQGWLDKTKIREIYIDSNVYISMSESESWGQSVAEALAAGLIVVSSNNEGADSLQSIGAPLQRLAFDDVGCLTTKLESISKLQNHQIIRLKENSFNWACSTIELSKICERWNKIYISVFDNNEI